MIYTLCKLIGAVFLLSSTFQIAIYMNKITENRYRQLQMLYSLLEQLKGNMLYMGDTLPECFADLADKYEEPFCSWMNGLVKEQLKDMKDTFGNIWLRGLDYLLINSDLERGDVEILSELKDKLGNADINTQVKAIEYTLLRIEEKRVVLKDELKDKKKAVISISFFAGAMILIMLL